MIQNYTFGRMKVAGEEYLNDLKIIKGNVMANWRRSEGHRLDVTDVKDILSARPAVLVVGTGSSGRMRVNASLCSALGISQIELIAEPTAEAVKIYNRLAAEGKDVAAAFHLTC
jgi:hypothetical protein